MPNDLIALKVPTIPSLPQHLVDLAWAVGTVNHPGQPTRYDLPAPLSAESRAEVEALTKRLTLSLDRMAPFASGDRTLSAGEAKAMLITKMIRGLAGAAQPSDLVAAAKIEMYADAVEDLPAWSIDAAIKSWNRGECPASICEEPKFEWPPAPAVLRKLALTATEFPSRALVKFANLLRAIPVAKAMDAAPIEGKGLPVRALRSM